MEFIDSKNPPEKGSFEYKKWLLDKDERIFAPNKIGNYSSKINSICKSILSDDGHVAEGIILIYSQYIDGGLIPVALALEEMGFSRYGDGAKSLFKTPPTELVDSRTLQPRKNKKDSFTPARYIMITGDPRLSPNNDFEIKAITNDDNKKGDKIKVVLISQAGSEGVDFKFLRQVHIIDPWYNADSNCLTPVYSVNSGATTGLGLDNFFSLGSSSTLSASSSKLSTIRSRPSIG